MSRASASANSMLAPTRGFADFVWPLGAALVCCCLAAPLVALGVAGVFSRYVADDYCTAGQVVSVGFVEAQVNLYVGWSGRFAATLLIALSELFGPLAPRVLPALALLVWVAVAGWAVRALARAATGAVLPRVHALVVGAALVFATLQATADAPQNVFWATGVLTYVSPLVLSTALVAWIARCAAERTPPIVAGALAGALALLAAGTSETFAAAEVAALVLAIGARRVLPSSGDCAQASSAQAGSGAGVRALLLLALTGAVLGLALLAVAPGNAVREVSSNRIPLQSALAQAAEFTVGWLRLTFARPHAAALGLLVASAAGVASLAGVTSRPKPLLPLLVMAGAAIVIFASMVPAYYALGSNPPGRAQIVPEYVLVCALGALAWFAGAWLGPVVQQRWQAPLVRVAALGVLLVLVVFGPLNMTNEWLRALGPARAYAAEWDRLDTALRAQPRAVVTIRPLQPTGLVENIDFIGPDRNDWLNACVARYYGLASIAADP